MRHTLVHKGGREDRGVRLKVAVRESFRSIPFEVEIIVDDPIALAESLYRAQKWTEDPDADD